MKKNKVNEISTTRLLKHFSDDSTLAVISTYRTERNDAENLKLLKDFKVEVRSMKLGFTEFVSKWVEEDSDTGDMVSSDERSLAIYGISREDAMDFGERYQQSSIIFKDEKGCREICTTDFIDYEGRTFKVGDIVRDFHVDSDKPFNLDDAEAIFSKRKGGPASKPVKGNRAFKLNEVYEVEPVHSATFANRERWIPIVQENSNRVAVKETSLNRLFTKHTDNGYVMVSACRADWSEDRLENRQINNIKTRELAKDISDAGYQYIPVKGGFIEKNDDDPEDGGTEVTENSFLIVNYRNKAGNGEQAGDFANLKNFAIKMCGKYNQDSVLVVAPGEKPTYFTRTGDVDMTFDGKSVRDNAQQFFTKIGGGRKFSFVENVVQPGTINGLRSRRMKGEICELAGYGNRHG